MDEVVGYLEQQINTVERAVLYNLTHVGEQCINAGRSTNSYKDQTGNLRSSIGYVLIMDGRIIQMSDFATVKTGAEGTSEGKEYLKQLISRYPEGIVLIVCAGMNYAAYVQGMGYDVLWSAELLAASLVPKIMNQIGFK